MENQVVEKPKRVLIAGIEQADNQFVKAVASYGLEPIHFGPNEGNGRSFPKDADAVIIVTSFTSHKYFWAAKDAYKEMGKKVFITNRGFSDIKDEFEAYFIGDLKKNLDKMKWNSRMYYMLGHFFKQPGTKFKLTEFEFKSKRFYPNLPPLGSFIQNATEDGTIERRERGKYVYKGLTERRVLLFKNKYDIEIPFEWQRVEKVSETPQPVPAEISAVSLIPEPVAAESAAPAEMPEHRKTSNEDIALLLSAVSDLDTKVDKLTKLVESMMGIYNPKLFNRDLP